MKIILLAGQSLQNKEWIENVGETFKSKYSDVVIMNYKHWGRQEGVADVELETQRFVELVNSFNEEYVVFAKSIGTVVFLNSLDRLAKLPVKAILVGVPIHLANDLGYDFNVIKEHVEFPVTVLQKRNDPMGSLEELNVIGGGSVVVSEYLCVDEGDDSHHYSNLEVLLGLV